MDSARRKVSATSVDRRTALTVGVAGTAGLLTSACAPAAAQTPAAVTPAATPTAALKTPARIRNAYGDFPVLHRASDLTRIRRRVQAGRAPWKGGFDRLAANPLSSYDWVPNPQPVIYRGDGSAQNYAVLYRDVHAAYQNALRWHLTGDRRHARTARKILNSWSATLESVEGNADRFLAAGIYGWQFAVAGDLMKGYSGFDVDRFVDMMLRVFHARSEEFLTNHNDAYITNYWSSWDLLSVACVIAVGALAEDMKIVRRAAKYLRSGEGNGSLPNCIPHVFANGRAQWIEVGRDQGHTMLGVGSMAVVCEIARNQDIDLYGARDRRFWRGAEYVARYNRGKPVRYEPYVWHKGAPGVWSGQETFTAASPASRGQARPIWKMIYNHYHNRLGLPCPNIAAMVRAVRPEGGGGDYGPNSGGFDHLGFGTLTSIR